MKAAGVAMPRSKIDLKMSEAHEKDTMGLQLLPKIGQRSTGLNLSSAFNTGGGDAKDSIDERIREKMKKKPLRYLSRDLSNDRAATLTMSNPICDDVDQVNSINGALLGSRRVMPIEPNLDYPFRAPVGKRKHSIPPNSKITVL